MSNEEKVEGSGVFGLGEPLPEMVIEVPPSVVRKAVEDWVAKRRMLGTTAMTINFFEQNSLSDLVEDVEKALEAAEKNAAIEQHPIRKLLEAVAKGADDGMVVGVAVATVGADKQTGQMFHCPIEQNVMSGAIGQLQWQFHMARHLDMLAQQQAKGGIVRPGR